MSKTFFISDNHFFHENIKIYCSRGYGNYFQRQNNQSLWFKTIGEMNSVMVERWNEKVSNKDEVYCLGDFFMGKSDLWLDLFKLLNGSKIHLICGNHDYKKSNINPKILECGFASIQDELYLDIVNEGKKEVLWLNHYPPGISKDKRELFRPPASRNYSLALFGHIHDKAYWFNNNGKLAINAGSDLLDFYPCELSELIAKTKVYPEGWLPGKSEDAP